MLNNPIQQIERTQDAYAGNPEGLQQRANMSKELIDLLAMQALQSDLAAQKRNMAMQQQGNPQTVKDQLEEGLMSEYRQKAAKDLGVGPSEGDVVERTGIAGQQMAQNAQMPQGGGGVASQAGPVNLAGGGIVSFANGSEDEGPVEAEEGQSLLGEVGSDIWEWAKENPAEAVASGLMLVPGVGVIGSAVLRGGLAAYKGLKGVDYATKGRKALDLAGRAVTNKKYDKLGDMETVGDATARVISPNKVAGLGSLGAAGIIASTGDDEESAVEPIVEPGGIADVAPPVDTDTAPAPADGRLGLEGIIQQSMQKRMDMLNETPEEFSPPETRADLTNAINEGIMSTKDMEAKATERENRVMDLTLGGTGEDSTMGRKKRQLQDLLDLKEKNEGTQRGRDLIEFLGAGFSQGAEKYVEQEDARRSRDEAYLTDVTTIENSMATLQMEGGKQAVQSYDKVLNTYSTRNNAAIAALSSLNSQDQANYRTKFEQGRADRTLNASLLEGLSSDARAAITAVQAGKLTAAQTAEAIAKITDQLEASQANRRSTALAAALSPGLLAKLQLPVIDLNKEELEEYNRVKNKVDSDLAASAGAVASTIEQLTNMLQNSIDEQSGQQLSSEITVGTPTADKINAVTGI